MMAWIRTISEQDFMDRMADAVGVESDPMRAQLARPVPDGEALTEAAAPRRG
jgi:hypothetical protein